MEFKLVYSEEMETMNLYGSLDLQCPIEEVASPHKLDSSHFFPEGKWQDRNIKREKLTCCLEIKNTNWINYY